MKNKYLLAILSCFFTIVIVIYLANLYHCALEYHGYVVGDWLITFRGGFVRRGLSGYSIVALSDFLNVEALLVVTYVQLAFYLAYMFLLFFLVKKKEIDIWFIILLLSPATLLFPIYDVSAVGRKEIILFVIFTLYILCLNRKMRKSYFFISAFSLALLIATLFHELVFFYTPYFILAAYVKAARDNEPFHLAKSLFLILGSFLMIICIFFYGKIINGSLICEELMEKGLDHRICEGVLNWTNEYSASDFLRQIIKADYFRTYGLALLLGFIPFALFVNYSRSKTVTLKKFFVVFLLLFLFSAPMFILAYDWGRWINIHWMMLLFTSTLLLKDRTPEWENENLAIPHLWNCKTALLKLINTIFFLAICFSYLAFWQMRHFDSFSVFYLDRYAIIEMEIYKTIRIGEELIDIAIENIQNL